MDATDDVSCRPNFAMAIYPGHRMVTENSFALQQDVKNHLSKQTPPTFLLQSEDDKVDGVKQALLYYAGLKQAGVAAATFRATTVTISVLFYFL